MLSVVVALVLLVASVRGDQGTPGASPGNSAGCGVIDRITDPSRKPNPPACWHGKIDLATAIWPKGRTMLAPEPIWVFVTIVLMGCVLLAVRAFRRRRR
jgi:hypothetical protein